MRTRWQRPPDTLVARFWRRVQKMRRCWVWTGSLTKGYGHLGKGGRQGGTIRAHRLSWVIAHGPLPPGMHILHRCDNPACVKPAHLYLGNQASNMADMVARGRSRRGERNHNSKLRASDVHAIRASSASGVALARHYEVSPVTICQIRARQRWRHI